MNERRRANLPQALTVVALLVLAAMIGQMCRQPDVPPAAPTPVVIATPTPGPDSGFHMEMTQSGIVSELNKRYDQMTDEQKDLANNFARKYPDGQ